MMAIHAVVYLILGLHEITCCKQSLTRTKQVARMVKFAIYHICTDDATYSSKLHSDTFKGQEYMFAPKAVIVGWAKVPERYVVCLTKKEHIQYILTLLQ